MSAVGFNERFEHMLFSRMSPGLAESFTDDQVSAIKTAFGAEHWVDHPIDLRFSLPLLRWYLVVVAGPDRRARTRYRYGRRSRRIRWMLNATVSTILAIWLAVMVFYIMAL